MKTDRDFLEKLAKANVGRPSQLIEQFEQFQQEVIEHLKNNPTSQFQSGEQLYRFVKASERLPEGHAKVFIKYQDDAFIGHKNYHELNPQMVFQSITRTFNTNDCEWLEALPQSPSPGEQEAVAFIEWATENYEWYWKDKIQYWFRSGDVIDNAVSTQQLYNLFLTE